MTLFIQKGDDPLSVRQATTRGLRYFEAQKQQWEREQGIVTNDPGYVAWAEQWVQDNAINAENNRFNHQLAAYRCGLSRRGRPPCPVSLGRWTARDRRGSADRRV